VAGIEADRIPFRAGHRQEEDDRPANTASSTTWFRHLERILRREMRPVQKVKKPYLETFCPENPHGSFRRAPPSNDQPVGHSGRDRHAISAAALFSLEPVPGQLRRPIAAVSGFHMKR
jgi:hypothetical protein